MPGLLDVLHDPADQVGVAIADGVDIDLDRVFEELVDQHRLAVADLHGLVHVVRQLRLVVDDLHRAPTEHVRRPHEHRVADLGCAI
jgi:hypothetical protein